MGISAAGQIASHQAQVGAARDANNAKVKNFHRQNQEYKVTANLDNVKYLNDVIDQDQDQDRTYQAMLDQWSDTDAQLKQLFATQDFAMEDAIIEMHEGSYAGTQTGATAARLAGKSAMEAGRKKARAIHSKMFAVDESNRAKEKTHRAAKHDSNVLFRDVAFAPVHGFAPAAPTMEAGPSKAGLILGLAGTAVGGFKDAGAFKAPNVMKTPVNPYSSTSLGTSRTSWSAMYG
tara:strand:- start:2554 stop:3252 length:699 start_codon:yes stop_codon:yes gene_type:complete